MHASPFLASAGSRERSALRVIQWVIISAGLTAISWLVLFLAVSVAAPSAVDALLTGASGRDAPASLELAVGGSLLVSASLALSAASTLFSGKLVFRRDVRTFVMIPSARFRWSLLVVGFSLYGLLLLGMFVIDAWITGSSLPGPVLDDAYAPSDRLFFALAVALISFVAVLAEEAEHRGILLQVAGAYTRSAPVLVILSGLVFSVAHLEFEAALLLQRAALGAMYAWLVLRTSGLELAVGAHAAHNVVNTWLLEPLSSGSSTVSSAPDLTFAYAVVNLGVSAAFLLCVTLLLRTKFLSALVDTTVRQQRT